MTAARKPGPYIVVLAGVDGAGKSSVCGSMLASHGLGWFNPDTFARELADRTDLSLDAASGMAWESARAQLAEAIENKTTFAFETTLGSAATAAMLGMASSTHQIRLVFCGLGSPEDHLERIAGRVAVGGQDVPESTVRELWIASRANLVELMPKLASLQVFDNSKRVAAGRSLPDPVLLLEAERGRMVFPDPTEPAALGATPPWAQPIVQAAFELHATRAPAPRAAKKAARQRLD